MRAHASAYMGVYIDNTNRPMDWYSYVGIYMAGGMTDRPKMGLNGDFR